MQKYFLVTEEIKINCIAEIQKIPVSKGFKVTISKAGTKSDRQRSLNWLWNSEISKSGVGGFDDKYDIHDNGKILFAIPILMRDDELFPYIWAKFNEVWNGKKEDMHNFLEKYAQTEKFSVEQTAEYLTEFQRYHLRNGVELTNPNLFKLELN